MICRLFASALTIRHCERSEAIQSCNLDCFVASLLAMTQYRSTHFLIPAVSTQSRRSRASRR